MTDSVPSDWSDEEIGALVRLWRAGLLDGAVADAVGRDSVAVRAMCRALREIAAPHVVLDRSGRTASWTGRDHGFLPEEIGAIVLLRQRRLGFVAIAKHLGLTPARVSRRCQAMGLAPCGRPHRERKRRKCLCCGHPFLSEGRHDHVCSACEESELWLAG